MHELGAVQFKQPPVGTQFLSEPAFRTRIEKPTSLALDCCHGSPSRVGKGGVALPVLEARSYYAVLYHTMFYDTVLCYTILYYTILHYFVSYCSLLN